MPTHQQIGVLNNRHNRAQQWAKQASRLKGPNASFPFLVTLFLAPQVLQTKNRNDFSNTTARYKPQDCNSLLLAVVLSKQIIPRGFGFGFGYLVNNKLNLAALNAKFKNDEVGASAYDLRVMLNIVLLDYSQPGADLKQCL
jgi:hypothetical protein